MGSYSGSSDWDLVPSTASFTAFKPRPAAARPAPAAPATAAAPAATGEDDPVAERPGPRPRLDAVIAFDTTGSMTPYLENVQQKMEYLAAGLLKLLDVEIALIAVGDHGDGRNMLQVKTFSSDLEELKGSIQELEATDGRDQPEAFECLFKVLNGLDYEAPTVLVLITDSIPHGMEGFAGEDEGCPFGVDWREELGELKTRLKNVYLVSCSSDEAVVALQRQLVGANAFVRLGDFRRLTNLIMALLMDEVGELDYFMGLLERQRGRQRRDEVMRLLGHEVRP